MKDRLTRVKKFIQARPTAVVGGAGIVVGAIAMRTYYEKFATLNVVTVATDDDLVHLLDEVKDGFLMFYGPHLKVALLTEKFIADNA